MDDDNDDDDSNIVLTGGVSSNPNIPTQTSARTPRC